jgi:hypothetical protein
MATAFRHKERRAVVEGGKRGRGCVIRFGQLILNNKATDGRTRRLLMEAVKLAQGPSCNTSQGSPRVKVGRLGER